MGQFEEKPASLTGGFVPPGGRNGMEAVKGGIKHTLGKHQLNQATFSCCFSFRGDAASMVDGRLLDWCFFPKVRSLVMVFQFIQMAPNNKMPRSRSSFVDIVVDSLESVSRVFKGGGRFYLVVT